MRKLKTRHDLHPYMDGIEAFIEKSGCKSIRFEALSPKCGGISLPDECVVSTQILRFPKETLLYILFHEIAHQYQYRKHGRDLMLDAYAKLPIDDAVSELLRIESIADRLAMLKLRSIIGAENMPPYRYYGCQNLEFFKSYLLNLRESIEEGSSIDEINKAVFDGYRLESRI